MIGYSAMAVSKVEKGKNLPLCWKALMDYYHEQGICFYAEGIIPTDHRAILGYADALRNRMMEGEHGSAYMLAFDKIVEAAIGSERKRREQEELNQLQQEVKEHQARMQK